MLLLVLLDLYERFSHSRRDQGSNRGERGILRRDRARAKNRLVELVLEMLENERELESIENVRRRLREHVAAECGQHDRHGAHCETGRNHRTHRRSFSDGVAA